MRQDLITYEDGQQCCPSCDAPLPAHDTWPGARDPFCGRAACDVEGRKGKWGIYIGLNERRCEAPDCENFLPPGKYGARTVYFTCSYRCWLKRRSKGTRELTCGCGCGEEFLGQGVMPTMDGLSFLSQKHFGDYQRKKNIAKTSGVFVDIVVEYLEGYAALHYKDQASVRGSLAPFFTFLNEKCIKDLNEVTPKTVTQYLAWAAKSGRRNASRFISSVSMFFRWAIVQGYRTGNNPVVSRIHNMRTPRRLPRPLEADELAFAWQLLDERGNTRQRLVMAIAEEAGLRVGEICQLRLQDVDLVRRRLFIRLPNKGSQERWAFFSDKTARYYKDWLRERDPTCGHDHLLHNSLGRKCERRWLAGDLKRVMCKKYRGKTVHQTGFDKWSIHRLRHTMASRLVAAGADAATVMAAGGWRTYETMAGYARVDPQQSQRGYDEAIRKSRFDKTTENKTTKVLSLPEVLQQLKIQHK